MSQKDKDYLISNYIPIFPPFGGVSRSVRALLGNSEELGYGPILVGWWGYLSLMTDQSLLWNILPSETYERDKDEFWMRNITRQIDYEHFKGGSGTEKGISFWPDYSDRCSNNLMYNDRCTTGLFNSSHEFLFRIKDEQFFPKDIKRKSIDSNIISNIDQLHNLITEEEVSKRMINFENPGVNMTLIFLTKIRTDTQLIYYQDPKEYIKRKLIKDPDMYGMKRGDHTIDVNSSLLPMLKWAIENEEKLQNNKKIKFVELCSMTKQKASPFDDMLVDDIEKEVGKNFEGKNNYEGFNVYLRKMLREKKSGDKLGFSKNDYIGVQCECLHYGYKNSGSNCSHVSGIGSEYFLRFLMNSFVNFEKSDLDMSGVEGVFTSEEEVDEYVNKCDMIHGGD